MSYSSRNKEKLARDNKAYREKYVVYAHEPRLQRILIKNKPARPELCQICGKLKPSSYHHWDDEHPERGLWLCAHCHRVADRVELGYHERYLELKKTFDGSVPDYKENRRIRYKRIVKQLRHLYWDKGLSAGKIGDMFGLGHSTIIHMMSRAGIPRRTLGQAQQLRSKKLEQKKRDDNKDRQSGF